MTQTIKPNDFVYIPYLSVRVFTARQGTGGKLSVFCGNNKEVTFLPSGKLGQHDATPLVYLATPETKAKLEEFHDIILQDIPVDEEVEKFSEALDELSAFYNKLYNPPDGNYRPSDRLEELRSIKGKLIEMFEARGAK